MGAKGSALDNAVCESFFSSLKKELLHRRSWPTSFRYTQRLAELGITRSVGAVADAYDNAMAESFVATLKTELVQGRPFKTRFDAELAVVEYLGWFNHDRLHSSLGDLPPAQFETDNAGERTMIEPVTAEVTESPPTRDGSKRGWVLCTAHPDDASGDALQAPSASDRTRTGDLRRDKPDHRQ